MNALNFKLISERTLENKFVPMIILGENIEYWIEGFAQVDLENIIFTESKQIPYDTIENEEIIVTNKEYNSYFKHFYGQVK